MVAALALAVLALPPVVNAIMAQAAQQADTSWLRDQDFDGQPEIDDPPPFNFQPPPGTPPPEDTPPPDPRDRPPQPVCQAFGQPVSRSLQEGISDPTSSFALVLQGNDRGVMAFINGSQVTGRPMFSLAVDGETVWSQPDRQYLNQPVSIRPEADQMTQARAPEEWVLSYDLRGVLYERFDMTLQTFRCEVPARG